MGKAVLFIEAGVSWGIATVDEIVLVLFFSFILFDLNVLCLDWNLGIC